MEFSHSAAFGLLRALAVPAKSLKLIHHAAKACLSHRFGVSVTEGEGTGQNPALAAVAVANGFAVGSSLPLTGHSTCSLLRNRTPFN
jgi:hypothetical protein